MEKQLKIMNLAENIVEKNVFHCASILVYELSKKNEHLNSLLPVLQQENLEEAILDHIMNLTKEETKNQMLEYGFDSFEGERIEEAFLDHLKNEDGLEEYASRYGIEPYVTEALEHWAVSRWLGHQLKTHGEMVTDFMDFCLWGRTISGQRISQDSVIQAIAK